MEEKILDLLWEYYKKAAEVFGRTTKENKKAGEPPCMQVNYSLLWFYLDEEERWGLNDLTRAFLGDGEARSRLCWNEEIPNNVEKYFLEGEHDCPNESQKMAIEKALANPLSFIQGPPGTGKTTAILNLVSCILGMGKNAAIVSSNKNALKAIWEKIDKFAQETGNPDCAEMPNKSRMKTSLAKLGNQENRMEFNRSHGLSGENGFKSDKITYTGDFGKVSVNKEAQMEFTSFLQRYPVITSTINSLKCCLKNENRICYDYVIVDEASQVDTAKGILAMSSAKHLVLVGDEHQLPPVLNQEQIQKVHQEYREGMHLRKLSPEQEQFYKIHEMNEERSFLDVCLEVFQSEIDKENIKVFLREHYRCHPGIIEFCNKEIYGGELDIQTKNYDKNVRIPIRVLWFEGDYCESCYEKEPAKSCIADRVNSLSRQKKERITKRNRKQADIFISEELPELIQRIEREEIENVGILSPFHGQLEEIKNRIQEYNARNSKSAQVVIEEEKSVWQDAKPEGEREDTGDTFPRLVLSSSTIHRSQGGRFDIVYLLPVEDGDWEWPWSQQKRLVNVAVSRAVKELRLIVSLAMMDPGLQWELTGYESVNKPERNAVCSKVESADKDDQMYIRKLAVYVRENAAVSDYERGFGFQRAGKRSIFDVGYKKRASDSKENRWRSEQCLENALREMALFTEKRLLLYHNVRIRDIWDENGVALDFSALCDEELTEYVGNDAELDYVVCSGEGRILLAIEVDGVYHRFNRSRDKLFEQKESDGKKNRLMKDVFHAECYQGNGRDQELEGGAFVFIRLPCDGSCCLETRNLWEQAEKSEQELVFPLEELLEKQLAAAANSTYRYVPMGVRQLIDRYMESGGSVMKQWRKNPYKALLDCLEADGYLEWETDCLEAVRHPEHKNRHRVPTKCGRNKGIVRGCRSAKDGSTYIAPYFLDREDTWDLVRAELDAGGTDRTENGRNLDLCQIDGIH